MEVILLERIGRLGQMGDVVKVKDGYARNFLLPHGKAMRATKESRLRFEKERVQLEARNLEMKREAEEVGIKLSGKNFVVLRQAGDSGQLYGSVSTRDVSDVITAGGYSIERTQVLLDRPIKALGVQEVRIGLHPEVIVKVNVNVARTEEEAERQARGEDVTQRREEEDEDRIKPEDTYRADDDAAGEADSEGEA
ncbi:MAG: 50S ribosomal protein L9 [Hyphomicrobiales bacterium]|nr:50S ribosomal protein L9 [Hyphomicrobiales bacterium]